MKAPTKTAVLFFLAALSGCSSTPSEPPVIIKTKYKIQEVPGVPVLCQIPDIPTFEDPVLFLKKSDDLRRKVAVLLASRELSRAHIIRTEEAIKACSPRN